MMTGNVALSSLAAPIPLKLNAGGPALKLP